MVGLARWASILVLLAAASGAAAQSQTKVYRVGYLGIVPPTANNSAPWDAFVDGLREHGYVEGRNLMLHRRYSAGQDARFGELAAELVRLNVDVIVSSTTNGALAAKQVTSTIPIVTIVAGDPVGSGLVASLARPAGNVTGLSSQAPDLAAKQLQLLREVAPGIKRVAVLWNPTLPQHQTVFRETQRGAATLRLKIESLELRSPDDLEAVFQRIAQTRPDGLPQRQRVVDLVARSRIPAIYGVPPYVDVGGLMSYSPNLADLFRRSTTYVDKLLRGREGSGASGGAAHNLRVRDQSQDSEGPRLHAAARPHAACDPRGRVIGLHEAYGGTESPSSATNHAVEQAAGSHRAALAGHDGHGALAEARPAPRGEHTPWHATQRAAWEALRPVLSD